MNCDQAQPHLPVHADGELPEGLRPALEAHLAECENCAAAVGRWQALRQCARRTLEAASLPAGLEQRVRGGLAPAPVSRRYRIIRIAAVFTAAAAIIAVSVIVQSRGRSGSAPPSVVQLTPVSAEQFAMIHDVCTIGREHAHDAFHKAGKSIDRVSDALAGEHDFKVLVPNLKDYGYELAGVCGCFPLKGIEVVHAAYRKDQPTLAGISVFSLDQDVKLTECGTQSDGVTGRKYDVACIADGVTVLKWTEQSGNFAFCSKMAPEQLRKIADSVDVAALFSDPAGPAFAALDSRFQP